MYVLNFCVNIHNQNNSSIRNIVNILQYNARVKVRNSWLKMISSVNEIIYTLPNTYALNLAFHMVHIENSQTLPLFICICFLQSLDKLDIFPSLKLRKY